MRTTLHLQRNGDALDLVAHLPAGVRAIEVRIESRRNQAISKISDVSPRDPQTRPPRHAPVAGREIWFPVVDIALTPGMEAVARFAVDGPAPGATCVVNGRFHPERVPLAEQVVIAGDRLEHWENDFFIEGADWPLGRFYLRQRHPIDGRHFQRTLRLLSPDWSGDVSLHAVTEDGPRELAAATLTPAPAAAASPSDGLAPERLTASLADTLTYLLRSRNQHPGSPTGGGHFLFYDLDARLFRTSHWIWTWGPTIRLLLAAARLPALAERFGANPLRRVARDLGDASLRFQLRDAGHPADGIVLIRLDSRAGNEYGYEGYFSPSDALFLAGWGWAPLYEATGDRRYLAAGEALALATERLIHQFPIVPQNYLLHGQQWQERVLDEAGFGVEGLAELYRVTGEARYRRIGRRYIDQLLAKFERTDGLWERNCALEADDATPCAYMTRGLGWAMEGLLAAHRLLPDGGYLARAERLAEHLLSWQQPDGCWAFNFNRPAAEVGISEKGTALWSLLLYRLHAATGEDRHLAAARQALRWCLDNQYGGPDPDARGSIVGCSPASGVSYRPWFRQSCAYTSAFFGLAVLEELDVAAL